MLDFAESFFDGIEVWRVRWKVFDTDAESVCKFQKLVSMVDRCVIEN